MIYKEGGGKTEITTNADTEGAGEALSESTRPGQANQYPVSLCAGGSRVLSATVQVHFKGLRSALMIWTLDCSTSETGCRVL